MTDRFTLAPVPSFWQVLMNDQECLDFFSLLYGKLLPQLPGTYASVPEEPRRGRGKIARLTKDLAFPSQRKENADLTFKDIWT